MKFYPGALFLLTSVAFADGAPEEMFIVQNDQKPAMAAQNDQASSSSCGFYLFGSALYWKTSIGKSDWAFVPTFDQTGNVQKGPNHEIKFHWNWGFRAGIGYNTHHDKWDTNLYFTGFRAKASDSFTTDATSTGVLLNQFVGVVSDGNNHASVRLSMIDWELGRNYSVSKAVTMRPYLGLKGAWIDQKRKLKATIPANSFGRVVFPMDTLKIIHKSKYRGMGPTAGVDTNWALGNLGSHSFNLFGDLLGALMYGHFGIKDEQRALSGNFMVKPKHLGISLPTPVLQWMMGLSWNTIFNKNSMAFGLELGYELQYWFRQDQTLSYDFGPSFSGGVPFIVNYSRESQDLSFHGVALDARFDF